MIVDNVQSPKDVERSDAKWPLFSIFAFMWRRPRVSPSSNRAIQVHIRSVADTSPMTRLQRQMIAVLASGFVLSLLGSWLQVGYPIWMYTFSDQGSFDDFQGERDEDNSDYCLQDCAYGANTPGSMLLGQLYGLLPSKASLVFFMGIYMVVCVLVVQVTTKRMSALLFVGLCFPFWFGIFRGNNDIYQFPLFLIMIWLFQRKRYVLYGIVLGTYASIEPYTLIFAFPLLLRRRYFAAAVSLILLAVAWVTPALYGLKSLPTFLTMTGESSQGYLQNMAINDGGILHGNSLFGALKVLFLPWLASDLNSGAAVAQRMLQPYAALSLMFLALFLVLFSLGRLSIPSIFLGLASLLCCLPPVAATYKLVLLLSVLLYYLYNCANARPQDRVLMWIVLAIMVPKPYIQVFLPSGAPAYLDSVINPLLMLLILALIAIKAFWTPDSRPEPALLRRPLPSKSASDGMLNSTGS